VIDFRYHLVSIVAVFLALAIGIVLGSTELRGQTLSALDRASSSLKSQLDSSNAQNRTLQGQASGDEAFAQAAEQRLIGSLLAGQRVLLVAAPGASGAVINGVAAAVGKAGATVTGQVALQPKFFDTSAGTQTLLSTLGEQIATTAGLTVANASAQQQAIQLLASATLSKDSPGQAAAGSGAGHQVSGTQAQDILSSFAAGGFLSTSGQPTTRATLAVVLTPANPPAGGAPDPMNQTLVSLAQELTGSSAATVVAGSVSGSARGSAIDALRGSNAASQVSSVDDADTFIGQIVVAQALYAQMNGHKAGSYGIDSGANATGPSPAPVAPTATPTASPTPTARAAAAKVRS